MEKKTPIRAKSPNNGGRRPGAGRPKGARDQITIKTLLETIAKKSGGNSYEEILVEDFLDARVHGDKTLVMKYHNLILQKVMNSLAKLEIADSTEAVEAKKEAFAAALARLANIAVNDTK